MYEYRKEVLKSLYPPVVVLKAAYNFLDQAYIHVEETETGWIIQMSKKSDDDAGFPTPEEFENELVSQALREQVYQRTRALREMLMARAMTSTIIDHEDPLHRLEAENEDISPEELNEILTDWFERYEK